MCTLNFFNYGLRVFLNTKQKSARLKSIAKRRKLIIEIIDYDYDKK